MKTRHCAKRDDVCDAIYSVNDILFEYTLYEEKNHAKRKNIKILDLHIGSLSFKAAAI
jgi:hypothetical protein